MTEQLIATELPIDEVDNVSTIVLEDKADLEILTDDKEMSLYSFDVDDENVSNCYDRCAKIWPPLLTDQDKLPEPFSIHERKDGSKQVVFNGMPLYFFKLDKKPTDIKGDGVGGTWHLIDAEQDFSEDE